MSNEAPIRAVSLQGNRYKCYAAHIAQLYVSKAAQKHLRTLGHFFKTTDTLENLLGLAAANYEIVASVPAVISYLESVSWDAIADYEERLQAILIDYLNSKPGIYQIYGEPVSVNMRRLPPGPASVQNKIGYCYLYALTHADPSTGSRQEQAGASNKLESERSQQSRYCRADGQEKQLWLSIWSLLL